jgi:hypothetical protein
MFELTHSPHPAIVARRQLDPRSPGEYLQLSTEFPPRWTSDPEAATAFASMREALRAAARLPAAVCAYGMPRSAELMASAGGLN